MEQIARVLGSFPGGLATGIILTLLGFAGKYFLDYKLNKRRVELEERKHHSDEEVTKRKLQIEERNDVYSVIGSTQASFVRSSSELYERLGNFFSNEDYTSDWMRPGNQPEQDGYYLTEYMRRLFNFIAWGRIAQDAINSLPVEVAKERSDLQRLYTFVNLANAILTYRWLFKDFDEYPGSSEGSHLFTGSLGQLGELGVRICKSNEQTLPREEFDLLYQSSTNALHSLRHVLTRVYVETGNNDASSNMTAAVVVARLAILRTVLAAYLSKDHNWAFALPDKSSIVEELRENLSDAESLVLEEAHFSDLLQRNLNELIGRYRCEWLSLHSDAESQ